MSDLESLIRGDEETRRELAERGGEITVWQEQRQGPVATGSSTSNELAALDLGFDSDADVVTAILAVLEAGAPAESGLSHGEFAEVFDDDSLAAMDLSPDESLLVPYERIGERTTGQPGAEAVNLVAALGAEITLKAGGEVKDPDVLTLVAASTTDGDVIEALITREDLTLKMVTALWQNSFFNEDKYQDYNRRYLMHMYGNPTEDLAKLTRLMHLLADENTIKALKVKCRANDQGQYYYLESGNGLFYLDNTGSLHIKILDFDAILEPDADLQTLAGELQKNTFENNRWLLPGLVGVMQRLGGALVMM